MKKAAITRKSVQVMPEYLKMRGRMKQVKMKRSESATEEKKVKKEP